MNHADRKLYHITHIDNLQGIIDSNGIVCKNDMTEQNYTNIAFDSLQERRANTRIPVEPFGTLHDYAPFFFCIKPPMLFTISRNNVEGAENTQSSIIYLVTNIDEVEHSRLLFVFTDGHAIMALTDFFNDLQDLDKIAWDIINASYWADTDDAPDRKRRKQAEFLIHKKAPYRMFKTIVCQNQTVYDKINMVLAENNRAGCVSIEIKPDWYY